MKENETSISDKLVPTSALLVNEENVRSLERVSEEIQQTIDTVNAYKRDIESLEPPTVNGEPWYKFSFGKASVTEVNKALGDFAEFVQKTFKLIAVVQNFQNENDMNICRLLGLLAMAEANAYSKITDTNAKINKLTTEDEDSAKRLKDLGDRFLKSLDDNAKDSGKKEKQMKNLINYVIAYSDEKTKSLRSITLTLSDVKEKQDGWIHDCESRLFTWEKDLEKEIEKEKEELGITINKECGEGLKVVEDNFERLKRDFNQTVTEQQESLRQAIKSLNEEIEGCKNDIEDKLKEEVTIVSNQNRLIEEMRACITEQNNKIKSLQTKSIIAVLAAIIAIVVSVLNM